MKTTVKKIVLALMVSGFAFVANAQSLGSTPNYWTNGGSTGIWSDGANWSLGSPPDGLTESSIVFTNTAPGVSVDCSIDASAAMPVSPSPIIIQPDYTNTITVDNSIAVDVGTFYLYGGTFTMGTNSFTCTGFAFGTGTNTRVFDGTNASQISINGNLSFGGSTSNGHTFKASSNTTNGTILTGSFTITTGHGGFTNNNGKFKFSAAANRTVPTGLTFYQLELNNSGSGAMTYTLGTTVTVTNKLLLTSNTGSTTSYITGTINLAGNLDVSANNGTALGTYTGTINFNGTTAQSIVGNTTAGAAPLPKITLNNTSAAVSITSGKLNCGSDFTINTGNTFTTNGNDLEFDGNVTNSGTLNLGSSQNITLDAGNTQSINFGASAKNVTNLTVNKSAGTATLNSAINLSNLLTVTAGTLNANGNLTLTSTGAGLSAQIAAVGGTLSGNYTVQRYITASRAWRFLASPVSATISSSWQNNIYITGAGSGGTTCPSLTTNSNGFDATTGNTPSAYTYNEPTAAWVAIPSTTGTSLTPGKGYRIFVRGNRSQGCVQLDGSTYTAGAVTLSATGAFTSGTNFGQVDVPVTKNTSGWNLVGNPYQATLDWGNATWSGSRGTATVNNAIYTYIPGTASTYASWVNGVSTNGGSQYISPGQAFFVAVTGSGNLTFQESYKYTSSNGAGLFKTTNAVPVLYAKFNDVSSTPLYNDETAIVLRPTATKQFDGEFDASVISFGTGNICNYNSGSSTRYAINSIPAIAVGTIDTVYLEVSHPSANGNFTLSFRSHDIPVGTSLYLVDNYLSAVVNIAGTLIYPYSTTTASASRAANRFMIVLGNSVGFLPVVLSKFNADKTPDRNVNLSWTTASEINSNYFDVERSNDQINYIKIGEVAAKGNSVISNNYSLVDANPSLNAVNYYRLKQVDLDNKFTYSPIIPVDFNSEININKTSAINIYPVPTNNDINISLNNSYKGSVTINIYDLVGKLILTTTGTISTDNAAISQNISNLNSGIYLIEVTSQNGEFKEQTKFVKE